MDFNPNDYLTTISVEDVAKRFPELHALDFCLTSLNDELTKRNYEIVTPTYKDFQFQTLKEYYFMEVDTIV